MKDEWSRMGFLVTTLVGMSLLAIHRQARATRSYGTSSFRLHPSTPSSFSLFYRHNVAPNIAYIKLPRPADFLIGVGNHFIPLCNPAHRAGQGKDRSKHACWNAEG